MQKIAPQILPMTPYELYLQRVSATFDSIRKTREGLTYTPAQFGGILGQQQVANSGVVLEVIDFEVH